MEAFRITRRDVAEVERSIGEARDRLRRLDGPAIDRGLLKGAGETAWTVAGAFGAGLAQGAFGGALAALPVPPDLGLGLVGQVLAYTGVFGDAWSDRVMAMSNGALSLFVGKLGERVAGGEPAAPARVAGALRQQHLSPLTEAEAAARAQRHRKEHR